MGIARKDDRHKEELVSEIADSFTRALSERERDGEHSDGSQADKPRFTITGDQRISQEKRR